MSGTNILVSAIVFPGRRGEAALRRTTEEPVSDRSFLYFSAGLSHYVNPHRKLQIVKDEPDNRILEFALTGRADAIVTGDRALLRLRHYRGVQIITLREYLDVQNVTIYS